MNNHGQPAALLLRSSPPRCYFAGAGNATSGPKISKLTVSGVGLRTHTGVGIRMFKALADSGINVDLINTSEVRLNVIVDGDQGDKGLKKLQDVFADVLR